MVPGRKQRGTATTQHSAGVGLEPWPERAEQQDWAVLAPPYPQPSALLQGPPRRAARHPHGQTCCAVPGSAAPRPGPHPSPRGALPPMRDGAGPFHPAARLSPRSPGSCASAAVGQRQGLRQPSISQDSRWDAKSRWRQSPPEAGSEPLHQLQEGALERSHLVQVSKEDP